MKQIGILGAGTWGLALAITLRQSGHRVSVWSPFQKELDDLAATHTHPYLKDAHIPEDVRFVGCLEDVCRDKDVLVFAAPSVYIRSTAEEAKPYIPKGQLIVDVAKGIEEGTLYTMSQILEEVLGCDKQIVALSGPTHAEEVALGIPTAIVASSPDESAASKVQDIFMNPAFRVYINTDTRGVELSGALKNVVALAAGISHGLGLGDNTIAAIITRGIAEIAKLGQAMGSKPETFWGLAGIGDLVVTCYSHHSRNHQAGKLIGEGHSLQETLQKVGMVVEGVNTLPAAMELSRRYQVELPIIKAVHSVLYGDVSPRDAVNQLMCREKRAE